MVLFLNENHSVKNGTAKKMISFQEKNGFLMTKVIRESVIRKTKKVKIKLKKVMV